MLTALICAEFSNAFKRSVLYCYTVKIFLVNITIFPPPFILRGALPPSKTRVILSNFIFYIVPDLNSLSYGTGPNKLSCQLQKSNNKTVFCVLLLTFDQFVTRTTVTIDILYHSLRSIEKGVNSRNMMMSLFDPLHMVFSRGHNGCQRNFLWFLWLWIIIQFKRVVSFNAKRVILCQTTTAWPSSAIKKQRRLVQRRQETLWCNNGEKYTLVRSSFQYFVSQWGRLILVRLLSFYKLLLILPSLVYMILNSF